MASRAPVSGFQRFSTVLSSAVLEWILMCLLFFDALFSFLVTKFSRLCKLQTPCIFCSRLDHIFGHERPGFYLDLICQIHRAEISPFTFCSVHGKLSDHTMCKDCLLSLDTEGKSDVDTCRSLAGKIGVHFSDNEDVQDVDGDGFHEFHGDDLATAPFLKKDEKLHAIKSLEDKSIGVDVSEVGISLSNSAGHSNLQNENGLRKKREKTLDSPTNYHLRNQGFDHFSHVGYSEVKINSDSDSEVTLTDDDEGKSSAHGDENIKDDLVSQNVESKCVTIVENSLSGAGSVSDDRALDMLIPSAPVSVSDETALEKLIHFVPVIDGPSESVAEKQINVDDLHDISTFSSSSAAGHCLEDSNLNQIEVQPIPQQSEFEPQDSEQVILEISNVKDNLETSDAACVCATSIEDAKDCCATDVNPKTSCDASFGVSDEKDLEKLIYSAPVTNDPSESIPVKQVDVGELHAISTFSSSSAAGHCLDDGSWNQIGEKAISPRSEFVPQDSKEVIIEDSNVKVDNLELSDAACVRTTSIDDAKDWCATDIDMRTSHETSDHGQSMSTHMDLNDVYKLAVGTNGSLPSPRFTEVIMGKDSSRVQEDLKLLISQISAAQGLESPWNELTPSPRVYGQGDEPVLQNITKTLSLERNESGLESLDGSIVSEVEGETAVERLKRQVELDRKSISLLYKELEEERNATAIAANQAMAMITRLQEEKAAMQMEALQYQRMMEEQAEYDHEALQKCNDLLTQREKEMQDLQAEFESYRKCFVHELSIDKSAEQSSNFHDREIAFCNKSGDHVMFQKAKWTNGNVKDPLSCFEDEETYISNCLTKLEKKLQLFSNNGVYNEDSSLNLDDDGNGLPDKSCADVRGDDFLEKNVASEADVGRNGQYSDDQKDGILKKNQVEKDIMLEEKISIKGTIPFEGNYGDYSEKVGYLVALENELSRLSQRLETLEADRNFLEHAINSLRNSDDGVRFIQEIACDLRELRRIVITQREHITS